MQEITVTVNGNQVTGTREAIAALLEAPRPVKAAPKTTRKPAPKKAKKQAPEWIKDHAKNRDARRALAASLRAQGIEPHGAAWVEAKAAAGIK